jgi:hypothetical protein
VPIELTIRITSPMDESDRELLSGVAVMTLAIANHELAKAKFPEAFGDDVLTEEAIPPAPCGMADDAGSFCVSKVGHRGRHRFRQLAATAADTAMVN